MFPVFTLSPAAGESAGTSLVNLECLSRANPRGYTMAGKHVVHYTQGVSDLTALTVSVYKLNTWNKPERAINALA